MQLQVMITLWTLVVKNNIAKNCNNIAIIAIKYIEHCDLSCLHSCICNSVKNSSVVYPFKGNIYIFWYCFLTNISEKIENSLSSFKGVHEGGGRVREGGSFK